MSGYDPRSHTIKLPGRTDKNGRQSPPIDYLPVAERVRWLREVHPDAEITSSIVELTDTRAVIYVRVSIPNGGSAMSIGNESKLGFPDYIGKAETVALGRALAILGYGIGFADDFEEDRERADPKDFEVNQANTVQETAKDRFDPRAPRKTQSPPANLPNPDVLPADPSAMVAAFDARVSAMPRPAWAEDPTQVAQKGVQLAQNLRTNGMKDAQRKKRLYPILTGMDSSKDMTPEQVALLFANSGPEGTKRLMALLAWTEAQAQAELV